MARPSRRQTPSSQAVCATAHFAPSVEQISFSSQGSDPSARNLVQLATSHLSEPKELWQHPVPAGQSEESSHRPNATGPPNTDSSPNAFAHTSPNASRARSVEAWNLSSGESGFGMVTGLLVQTDLPPAEQHTLVLEQLRGG